MLVLSRSTDGRILIGNDIVITVVQTSKDSVRLGITAPKDVVILREELLEKSKNRQKQQEAHRSTSS